MQLKKRLPSAAERTVSMFTGKTDAEAGYAARDGSEPEERRHRYSKPKPLWEEIGGRMGEWHSRPLNASIRSEKDSSGETIYVVFKNGRRIDWYATIVEAAKAAEAL